MEQKNRHTFCNLLYVWDSSVPLYITSERKFVVKNGLKKWLILTKKKDGNFTQKWRFEIVACLYI